MFAADAVARMSGTVGVAAVTAGPGMYFYICLHSGMRSEVCRLGNCFVVTVLCPNCLSISGMILHVLKLAS